MDDDCRISESLLNWQVQELPPKCFFEAFSDVLCSLELHSSVQSLKIKNFEWKCIPDYSRLLVGLTNITPVRCIRRYFLGCLIDVLLACQHILKTLGIIGSCLVLFRVWTGVVVLQVFRVPETATVLLRYLYLISFSSFSPHLFFSVFGPALFYFFFLWLTAW